MQHPAQRGAHERRDEQLPDPRISQTLAHSQNQTLRRRIHRHVSRTLDDVKTFEVRRHGMRRVRELAMGEGIGGQKITKLVVPPRLRNAKKGKKRRSRDQNEEAHRHYAEHSSTGQPGKPLFDGKEGMELFRFSSGAKQN